MSCETIWIKKNQNNYVISSDNAYSKLLDAISVSSSKLGEGFAGSTIIEGAEFEMFPDSSNYFKSCKKLINTNSNFPIRKIITSIVDTIVSPFYEIDSGIETLIINFINLENEIEKTANKAMKSVNKIGKSKINTNFFNFSKSWTSNLPSQFQNESSKIVNDVGNEVVKGINAVGNEVVKDINLVNVAANQAANQINDEAKEIFNKTGKFINSNQKIEMFSPNTPSPYNYNSLQSFLNTYATTIDSLSNNHPWIEENELYNNLAQYYCQKLNEFENTYSSYSSSDLLEFNKELDLSLTDVDNNSSSENYGNPVLFPVLQNIEFTCFPNPNPEEEEEEEEEDTVVKKKKSAKKSAKKLAKKPTKKVVPDIKKDAQLIKEFIYQILLLPIYFYITYNFYYVFYFRKKNKTADGKLQQLGCAENEYPNWDYIFNNKYTGFITEFMFKPAQMLMVFLNCFKYDESNYAVNKVAPYISFILIFLIIMRELHNNLPKLWSILVGLYNFKIDNGIYSYCSGVIWLFFAISCIKTFVENVVDEGINVATGKSLIPPTPFTIFGKILMFIVYWIFKGFVTASIIPFSACIFIVYLFMIMFGFCGIDNIKYINQYLYSKLFDKEKVPVDIFDEKESETSGHGYKTYKKFANLFNKVIDYVREPCKYIFYFLFEIVLFILYESFNNKSNALLKSEKSKKIKIALLILTYIIRLLLGIWVVIKGIKFKDLVKEQEEQQLNGKIKDPDPKCESKNFSNVKSIFSSLGKQLYGLFDVDKSVEKYTNKLVDFVGDNPIFKEMGINKDTLKDMSKQFDPIKMANGFGVNNMSDVFSTVSNMKSGASNMKNLTPVDKISKMLNNPEMANWLGNSMSNSSVLEKIKGGDFSSIQKSIMSESGFDPSHISELTDKFHEMTSGSGLDPSKIIEFASSSMFDASSINNLKEMATSVGFDLSKIMESDALDNIKKMAAEKGIDSSNIMDTVNNLKNMATSSGLDVSKLMNTNGLDFDHLKNMAGTFKSLSDKTGLDTSKMIKFASSAGLDTSSINKMATSAGLESGALDKLKDMASSTGTDNFYNIHTKW